MNKRIVIVLTLALAMLMVLTGCNKSNESSGTVTIEGDLGDYIESIQYKDLPYYTEEAEVTDEELQSQIDLMLQYASTVDNVTEGVVEDGDTINVAFVGKIDGEEFEGGSSESFDITVGVTSMIDGFVEGLIGKNVGETVTLDLVFPEDYHNEEVKGKPVVFDVTINSKRITTTPELTDDFVKEYYDADSIDAFKTKVREDMLKSKEDTLNSTIKNNLWTIIQQETVVKDYPEEIWTAAEAQVAGIEEEYQNQATMYGMEWTEFLETMMQTNEDGFKEMMDGYIKNIALGNLITQYIAKEEGVSFTDKEFKDELNSILEGNGLTEESFEGYYNMTIEEYAEQNGWRENFLLEKVLDKILELGKEVSKEEFDAFVSEKLGTKEEAVAAEPIPESEEEAEAEIEEGIEEIEEGEEASDYEHAEEGEEASEEEIVVLDAAEAEESSDD